MPTDTITAPSSGNYLPSLNTAYYLDSGWDAVLESGSILTHRPLGEFPTLTVATLVSGSMIRNVEVNYPMIFTMLRPRYLIHEE